MGLYKAQVILLRHGTTAWSAAKRFTGHTNIPLNEQGHVQAEHAAKRLAASYTPCAIMSSDLLRAKQTAAHIAQGLHMEVSTHQGLREEFLGPWEGHTVEEVEKRFADGIARWRLRTVDAHSGREGLLHVGQRALPVVTAAVSHYADQIATRPLLVVTHVNTVHALIALLLGLPTNYWFTIGSLTPGAWSLLQCDESGNWQLTSHNTC